MFLKEKLQLLFKNDVLFLNKQVIVLSIYSRIFALTKLIKD